MFTISRLTGSIYLYGKKVIVQSDFYFISNHSGIVSALLVCNKTGRDKTGVFQEGYKISKRNRRD